MREPPNILFCGCEAAVLPKRSRDSGCDVVGFPKRLVCDFEVAVLEKRPPPKGAVDTAAKADPPNKVPACEGAEDVAAEEAPKRPPCFVLKNPPDCGWVTLLLPDPLHSRLLATLLTKRTGLAYNVLAVPVLMLSPGPLLWDLC